MNIIKKLILLTILVCLISTCLFPMISGNSTVNEQASTLKVINWWPMFKMDPGHSSYALTSTGPGSPDIKWMKSGMPNGIENSPAIFDGKLIVATRNNIVYCYDMYNGNEIWSYESDDVVSSIRSSPAIHDDKVYVGLAKEFVCLDIETGIKIWDFQKTSFSSPSIYNDKIYVGCEKSIYCLNSTDGSVIWNYQTNGGTYDCSPAVEYFLVCIGSRDGYMYCFDSETGDKEWEFNVEDEIRGSPVIESAIVIFTSLHGSVYAIDLFPGTLRWVHETSDIFQSSPTLLNEDVLVGSENGIFYCLDELNNGEEKWRIEAEGSIHCCPVLTRFNIYFGCEKGYVYCLDWNGRLIWKDQLSNNLGITGSPVVAMNHLYVCLNRYHENTSRKIFCYATNYVNQPPNKPEIIKGETDGIKGEEYFYEFTSNDSEGDLIYYTIDWGDNTDAKWFGLYESGELINISHIWNQTGDFTVRIKARDMYGFESDWASLQISMPRNKVFEFSFLQMIFNILSKLFPVQRIFI